MNFELSYNGLLSHENQDEKKKKYFWVIIMSFYRKATQSKST